MRLPNLPPLKAVFSIARDELLPKHLGDVVSRLELRDGYALIRSDGGDCLLGPSMVNDACQWPQPEV
ncbi:hypothetical protein [Vulcanisaeta sp. JCM 16161]|uniref:hypothetical protein n=1 Tax=Vulcanisaeta sp. JCM 16161 TaxID=1295372 RepID=UPI0006D22181|nr:hypothetical protein [Vulcanisaeta sp. JCM 16161]